MTSLYSTMAVAMTGIQAATTQMQLAASNMANAGTPGYSKQRAVLESVVTGGVLVTRFERVQDAGALKAVMASTAEAGYYGSLSKYYTNIQSILGSSTSEPALADSLSTFISDWQELAASPESETLKTQVIQDGIAFADQIKSVYSDVADLKRQVTSDIDTAVEQLNDDLRLIWQYNKEIASASSQGISTGSLEDERDQVLARVASMVKISTMDRGDGAVAVFTDAGYTLLDASTVREFSYNGTDIVAINNPAVSLNTSLTGGSVEAMIGFVSDTSPAVPSADSSKEIMRKLLSQLDAIANAFTPGSAFATAYSGVQSFFTGTDAATISVNASLVSGATPMVVTNANAVVTLFNRSDLTLTADGLNATGLGYNEFAPLITARFQQSAAAAEKRYTAAESERSYLEEMYANFTGVNTDEELISLTTLQSSYSASAKVISIVNELFDTLERML